MQGTENSFSDGKVFLSLLCEKKKKWKINLCQPSPWTFVIFNAFLRQYLFSLLTLFGGEAFLEMWLFTPHLGIINWNGGKGFYTQRFLWNRKSFENSGRCFSRLSGGSWKMSSLPRKAFHTSKHFHKSGPSIISQQSHNDDGRSSKPAANIS